MKQFDLKQPTQTQSLAIILISLVAAYGLTLLAIDTGSLWQYLLSFIALLLVVRYTIKFVKKFQHGGKQ